LFGEALLFNGKPNVADVADDGTIVVLGEPALGSVAVLGVLWNVPVPALVLIVTDGTPTIFKHVESKTRNENV
jgi:hypothetical protein